MSSNRFSLRSALGRARGLGPSHSGTGHWLAQRLTALVMLPLAPWFIYSLLTALNAGSIDLIHQFFASPLNAVTLVVLLVAMIYHAMLGLQVIVEDYVHNTGFQLAGIYIIKFFCIILTVISILSVIKLHLGTA